MTKFRAIQQKLRFSSNQILLNVGKTLAISVLILYLLFIFLSNKTFNCSNNGFNITIPTFKHLSSQNEPPTNISHILFGISASTNAWKNRKPYIESWWNPNVTRGFVFFEENPTPDLLPWPESSPPYRVAESVTHLPVYARHVRPLVIRIVRTVLEAFREGQHEGVRWFVMGDDDTIFFVENLVRVLGKYDHKEYFYIGGVSECTKSNFDFSYEMAYGGGGFALSYPLAEAVVKNLDECIDRYPYLKVSDQILQYCIADLGISLTPEKGFHQVDLVDDISGLLSAHPLSPLVSLHHFDIVRPIFPTKDRHQSLNHFMTAAKADQPRLLQQTICYNKPQKWSFSIAWGYSTHIYEQLIPRSILKKPLETFTPWSLRRRPPDYMFNTRPWLTTNPCEAPHIFFLESVIDGTKNSTRSSVNATEGPIIITTYIRSTPRGLPPCSSIANYSADHIERVRVISPAEKLSRKAENRGECCDIVYVGDMNITEVKLRACMKGEVVAP